MAAPASRYEYATEMWRDRDFILGGKVIFSASFIDPEVRFHFIFCSIFCTRHSISFVLAARQVKEMLREGLRQKRITWPLIMNNSLIIKLTHASMPTYMLKMVSVFARPFQCAHCD